MMLLVAGVVAGTLGVLGSPYGNDDGGVWFPIRNSWFVELTER